MKHLTVGINFCSLTYGCIVALSDGQNHGEIEMMKQMSLNDGYPSDQHGNGLPNNQGYSINHPMMMNKEHQT